jgi:hypothetical protein
MDTSNIKHGDVDGRGWYDARTSVVVAKVEDSPEVLERYSFEMGSSPTLREVSIYAAELRSGPAYL